MVTWTVQFLQGKQKSKNSAAENVALVVFLSKEVDEQDVACKREEKMREWVYERNWKFQVRSSGLGI